MGMGREGRGGGVQQWGVREAQMKASREGRRTGDTGTEREYWVEVEMEKETKQWDRRFINIVREKEKKSIDI